MYIYIYIYTYHKSLEGSAPRNRGPRAFRGPRGAFRADALTMRGVRARLGRNPCRFGA